MERRVAARAARRIVSARTRRRLAIGASVGIVAVAAGPTAVALAATPGTGTTSMAATAGSLSIGTTTPETISVPVAGSATGVLPAATWSDTTGSGTGWNGTVAVSDLTYTGKWTQVGGTAAALGTAGAFSYTGTADGVEYTVTVSTGGSTTFTPYTWTSNTKTAGNTGGSGTATNGTPATIGTLGVKIDFASGKAYPSGAEYRIKVGTESATAFSLDSAAGSVTKQTGTSSTPPTLVGTNTLVTGTRATVDQLGSAVKFLSAAQGTGMGTYLVKPGVRIQTDPSTWTATYSAKVQYSIVQGP